ncbi:nucleotide exchange factor GrpE [Synechococcus elongatus]|uniref:Protein GrpE n=2 Tax=Synechococcus elongatus TaxID=32046 RepID=GRPE_SYNE7|nr:nucleotide exchange factor GrpE [Synechococcus elongatus]Q59984.2 RecName: Full=Protein GrpE; AltName: Full=HSP-70 cofactor [Synechococcus elongatus PCC 7942 = FACHB-805]ABB58102.1 heat shock protein GrpE [Synechococcus elongatus PCC 7942 = FACHB-805]AJD57422.1 protein GrpE [Synechococcus elongatus UTEX 2973]MBD2586821.1 nucleotide exchange factor GrpE [Synechococcus elongatus FACHB-242]MBD2687892.1 nucleotide exchange factor GrpE [Synechococcus elongatus FACHB-1061]MBD2706397.1 nucleotide
MSEHQTPPEEDLTVANGDSAEAVSEPDVTVASGQEAAELAAQLALVAADRDRLKTELDEQNSAYLRLAADFENFRRRTLKEREELELQSKRTTITELLPVIDNFDRARAQIKPQGEEAEAIHKSYQGLYKQLVDCLKRIGVSPMRAEGQPFDPSLHDAVLREETTEHPDGIVLEELQRGYLLGDLVLRHALVKVSIAAEENSAAVTE